MGDLLTSIVPMAAEQQQNVMNMITSGIQNRANLKYNAKMYQIQRRDALADWEMQNKYNSPAAQMQRLKDAGLNPNLVYGNGATATASQQPRSSNVGNFQAQIPPVNYGAVGASIMNYYDADVKKAQADNLKAMKAKNEIETALKTVAAARGKLEYNKASELYQTSIDVQKATLQKLYAETAKTNAETRYSIDENTRREALQQPTLQAAVQKVINMQKDAGKIDAQTAAAWSQAAENNAQIKILNTQWQKWWSKGSNPNSSAAQNLLKQVVDSFSNPASDLNKSADQWSDKNPWFKQLGKYMNKYSPY